MELKYKAYQFSVKLIKFLSILPKSYINFEIYKQLLRSGTSIGANIVEAQNASSRKDFANYYNISLKSATETKYWLALLRDTGKIDKVSVNVFLTESDELCKIISASLLTLKGKRRNLKGED
jgi:four helix bundle protein